MDDDQLVMRTVLVHISGTGFMYSVMVRPVFDLVRTFAVNSKLVQF